VPAVVVSVWPPVAAAIATAVPIVVDVDDLGLFFFAAGHGLSGRPFAEDGPLEQDGAAGQRQVG
jgi:hypothetical protein